MNDYREIGLDVSDGLQEKAEKYILAEKAINAYFKKWPNFNIAVRQNIKSKDILDKPEEMRYLYDDLSDVIEEISDLEMPDFNEVGTTNFEQINKTLQNNFADSGERLVNR